MLVPEPLIHRSFIDSEPLRQDFCLGTAISSGYTSKLFAMNADIKDTSRKPHRQLTVFANSFVSGTGTGR